MTKKLVIGWDHAGYPYVEALTATARDAGFAIEEVGEKSTLRVDYPDVVVTVIERMKMEAGIYGLLLCGSGIGMSIAANRYRGIRAALCRSEYEAWAARVHNNANILCLGTRVIGLDQAQGCLHQFLTTPFPGEARYVHRIEKLDALGR